MAKTYKIIGTLYIINERPEEAKDYLTQAYRIFEAKGMDKLAKEISGKLKLVTSTRKENIEGQESFSPDKKSTSIKRRKGKKKTLKY